VRLVVLHGPPGVGKHTIGQSLAVRLGYEYLSSHRAMEEAGTLLGWGTQPFLRVRDAWLGAMQGAVLASPIRGLVWTTIFEPTVDLDGWNQFLDACDEPLVIDLRVAAHEHAQRLASRERLARGKSGTIDDIGPLVERGEFTLPPVAASVLVIETTDLAPNEAVDVIAARVAR
jgi:hypothetical protein